MMIVTLLLARRMSKGTLYATGVEYVPPRVELYRVAFRSVDSLRSRPGVGVWSGISGLVGAVLILTQIVVFFACWLAAEVVGPIVVLAISGPFRWLAPLASSKRGGVGRLGFAVLWTAAAAAPSVALAAVAAWAMC